MLLPLFPSTASLRWRIRKGHCMCHPSVRKKPQVLSMTAFEFSHTLGGLSRKVCGVDSRLRGNDVWLVAEMKKILKSRKRTQEVLQNKGLDFLECAKQTQNEPKITAFCCVCGPFLPIQDERSRPATEGDVAQALLPVFDEAIYQPWTQARLPVPRHQRQWDSLSPIERANISGRRR